MNNEQNSELRVFVGKLKNGIWALGVASLLFGIIDRTIASLSDGYLSATDIIQLITAFFLLSGWLYLKPTQKLHARRIND